VPRFASPPPPSPPWTIPGFNSLPPATAPPLPPPPPPSPPQRDWATVAVTVSTLAGSAGSFGSADGQASSATFESLWGVAVDGAGNVYVADFTSNRIRELSASGLVSTLAGSGSWEYADGQGVSASFRNPYGLAVDDVGNVYVADNANNRIRVVSATGGVSTLTGTQNNGYAEGQGSAAQFSSPRAVAVDGAGNVYVADTDNHRIRVVNASGYVRTLAGSGVAEYADDQGTSASFKSPMGVAVDGAGNVYVADTGNMRIRVVNASGYVRTLAGNGVAAFADGQGMSASFYSPNGVAVDGARNVYTADPRLRVVNSSGYVSTLLELDGIVYAPGIAVDVAGNHVYLAETNRIRVVTIAS